MGTPESVSPTKQAILPSFATPSQSMPYRFTTVNVTCEAYCFE